MNEKMPFHARQHILLTGAGFSKNFGGFLAEEMWSRLFSHPMLQATPKLRELMLDKQCDFDYEAIYQQLHDRQELNQDKNGSKAREIFQKVLLEVYDQLDSRVRDWGYGQDPTYPVNGYLLDRELLTQFTGDKARRGFFFTLNQDLFVERRYQNGDPFSYPGIPKIIRFENEKKELEEGDYVSFPDDKVTEETEPGFLNHAHSFYVKLHGSCHWRRTKGEKRELIMVGGQQKEAQISNYPFLQWYWELFKKAVRQGNTKLLIIGFSFRDRHLNLILKDAIEKHGLKIYVLSPVSIRDWKNCKIPWGEREAIPFVEALSRGLSGYFQFTLRELFPINRSSCTATSDWLAIKKAFFNAG